MPLYDVYCDQCPHKYEERDVILPLGDEYDYSCPLCGWQLRKKCNCSHFKLVYNNKTDICAWSDHNYETSQYWRKVDAAREKGENVKSPDDKY